MNTFFKTLPALVVLISSSTVYADFDSLFKQQQNKALKDYHLAVAGDSKATASLKERANKGDRWAAFQYGYLAQTGQLLGLNGKPNINLAMRSYNLASKTVGDDGKLRNIYGNYLAAYNMGVIYYHGLYGVKADGATALRWFQAGALKSNNSNQVFWPAAVYAARIYSSGYGVRKDYREAFKYWKYAASKNEPVAVYEVGRAQFLGIGTDVNKQLGMSNLKRAAELWNIDAMYMLSMAHLQGNRFQEPNISEAVKWLLIAGTKRPQYDQMATQLMNQYRIPPNRRKMLFKAAGDWMNNHTRVPEAFDYRVPVNDDPAVR